MGADQTPDFRQSLASALEWWRDAGVDMLVDDEPRDWLARPAPKPEGAPAKVAVAEPAAAPLPPTLDAFLAWRMGDDAPEAGWMGARIAPSGDPANDLMILTDLPEAEDADSGILLGGAPGRLLDRILAAIGRSRDSAYIASIATVRPVTGQIPPDALARLGEIARHHVALAAPKRLLLLGGTAKSVFDTTNGSDEGHNEPAINQLLAQIELVTIRHPRFLLTRPAAKADAWTQLIRFTGGETQCVSDS